MDTQGDEPSLIEPAHVLAEDLEELASARPTSAVRLLPGFDQYVLGPGTAGGHVGAGGEAGCGEQAERLDLAGRGRGWCGVRDVELDGERVRVAWFGEAGKLPRKALEAKIAHLSSILDRGLRGTMSLAYRLDRHETNTRGAILLWPTPRDGHPER